MMLEKWKLRVIDIDHECEKDYIILVYVIEKAAYGVLFTSCLCQKPERARNERVRAFDTNNE